MRRWSQGKISCKQSRYRRGKGRLNPGRWAIFRSIGFWKKSVSLGLLNICSVIVKIAVGSNGRLTDQTEKRYGQNVQGVEEWEECRNARMCQPLTEGSIQ